MKEFRQTHPIIYSVVAVALGMALQLLMSWLSDLSEAAGLPDLLVVASAMVVKLMPVVVALALLGATGKMDLIRHRSKGFGRGMACGAVLIGLFGVMGLYAIGNVILGEAQVDVPIIIKVLIYFFVVGIGEEFLVRAVAGETLLEHFGLTCAGVVKACVVSGVIFGLMHAVNLFQGVGVQDVAMQVMTTTGVGMLFAAVYFRCGNIWAPVVLHMLWDASLFAATTSASFGQMASSASSVGGGNPIGGAIFFAFFIGLALFLLRKSKIPQVKETWSDTIESHVASADE